MRKRYALYLFAVAFLIAIAYYVNSSVPAGSSDKSVDVIIPDNTASSGIARILKEKGVVKSEFFFMLYLKVNGKGDKLKAGKYRLKLDMPYYDLVNVLSKGSNVDEYIKLTIPEGYNIRQIADELSQQGWNGAKFLEECRNGRFDYPFLKEIPPDRPNRLEGYLFPDTYFVKRQMTEHQIIDMMLKRFNDVVVKEYSTHGAQISLDKAVIIASMIEKEARVDIDRPLIASVIYNRLNKGMKLQIDATVLYALGVQKDKITTQDLAVKSPYNTYYVKGLPIGPIGNPGLKSFKAALNPAQTDYYYYVARGDGTHAFSKDYNQHLQAIQQIRGSVRR
ncbi:endolytic transglycosylase MltG [Caldanaerobius polysaccharolyticus]|uniref:endolytic transglycosylase MltG n=1 Tax=Caldanaerobius polysaccharolyticus TaxID=44256 RepID=UPI0006892892|nr:endolytic transglycosylase MltG [Caldanaerobius polysaccharolyticus]